MMICGGAELGNEGKEGVEEKRRRAKKNVF